MQLRTQLCVALIAALWLPAIALADTTITGEKKGAFFQITVPTVWNGDLVIHNHGFDFNPPAPNPSLGSLAALQLSQGYAVAASSYSNCCWTLFSTKKDLNRLLEIFEDNFGASGRRDRPRRQPRRHRHRAGGREARRRAGGRVPDLRRAGGQPLLGRRHRPAPRLRRDLQRRAGRRAAGRRDGPAGAGLPAGAQPVAIATAVNTCTGVLTPVAFRTPAQQARLNQLKAVTTLPENFIVTDMVFVTNGLSNLIFAPDKLDGGQGVGNIGVTYNDPGIDASIQRVASVKKPRKELEKNYTPKGDVNATKIVSIHTDGDGLVIVEQEKEYQDVVDASNLTVGIVDEAGNTHCGFTSPELVAGWEELRDWIAGGPQPTAADLQARCLTLGPAGPVPDQPGLRAQRHGHAHPAALSGLASTPEGAGSPSGDPALRRFGIARLHSSTTGFRPLAARGRGRCKRSRRSRGELLRQRPEISSAALGASPCAGWFGSARRAGSAIPRRPLGRPATIAARAYSRASARAPLPREQRPQDGLGFGARLRGLRREPPARPQSARLLEERLSGFEASELAVEGGDRVPILRRSASPAGDHGRQPRRRALASEIPSTGLPCVRSVDPARQPAPPSRRSSRAPARGLVRSVGPPGRAGPVPSSTQPSPVSWSAPSAVRARAVARSVRLVATSLRIRADRSRPSVPARSGSRSFHSTRAARVGEGVVAEARGARGEEVAIVRVGHASLGQRARLPLRRAAGSAAKSSMRWNPSAGEVFRVGLQRPARALAGRRAALPKPRRAGPGRRPPGRPPRARRLRRASAASDRSSASSTKLSPIHCTNTPSGFRWERTHGEELARVEMGRAGGPGMRRLGDDGVVALVASAAARRARRRCGPGRAGPPADRRRAGRRPAGWPPAPPARARSRRSTRCWTGSTRAATPPPSPMASRSRASGRSSAGSMPSKRAISGSGRTPIRSITASGSPLE